jgi:O-antigen/teichoic acid export membrane protein
MGTSETVSGVGKLIFNAGAMLGVGVLQRGLGLLLIAVLSRLLDPKGIGTFTFVQSTSNSFAGMSRLGVDAGIHVQLAGLTLPDEKMMTEAVLGQTLTLTAVLSVGPALALALFSHDIAGRLFAAPELAPFVIVSAALVVAQMGAQYCYAVFSGFQAFLTYSRITIATSLISAFLTVGGALAWGAWGGTIGFVLGQAVAVVMLGRGVHSEAVRRGVRLVPRWPRKEALSVLAIGLPFYFSVAIVVPAEFVSLGLLSQGVGVEALGELRVTQSMMSLASMIPVALAGPMISHLAANNVAAGNIHPVQTQLKFIWMLALVIVTTLGAVWPFAVELIFGSSYLGARTMGVLALSAFVPNMLASILTGALLAMKRSLVLLFIGAVQGTIMIAAASVLIPWYGLAGYLTAQSLAALGGAVLLIISIAALSGRAFLQGWMISMTVGTCIIVPAALYPGLHELEVLSRAIVGAGSLAATAVVCWFALASNERVQARQLPGNVRARIEGHWTEVLRRR